MILYGTSDRPPPVLSCETGSFSFSSRPVRSGPRGIAAVPSTREFSFRSITLAILGFVFLYVFTLRGGEILIRHRVGTLVTRAVMTQSEELLSGRIGYDEFVGQVLAYVEPEYQEHYRPRRVWGELQEQVLNGLEALQ